MRTIPLTQGYEALVDDEDYEELSRYRWFVSSNGRDRVYASRTGKHPITGKWGTVGMHRHITHTESAGRTVEVDHRNHDTLDNRRENLVVTDRAGNAWNRKGPAAHSTTGVRNVYPTASGKYAVHVRYRGVLHYFGHYSTVNEASEAAASARSQLESS
jgi:hypothetical protein